MNSEKAEDPYKVGKFGIGFNSVYHLTDVPFILSGKFVAFFDPLQQVSPPKVGYRSLLEEANRVGIDSLKPFELCGYTTDTIDFPGTFFRFPLRRTPSNLSEKLWNIEEVKALADAIRVDAYCVLLFLRSVAKLTITEIMEDGSLNELLDVSMSAMDISSEQDALKIWRMNIEQGIRSGDLFSPQPDLCNIVEDFIEVQVKVTDRVEDFESVRDWLLVTHVGSKDQEVRRLSRKLKSLPWVSVAAEISGSNVPRSGLGRLCVFLPLPPEITVPLPVLINGYFSLTDDRRSVKFPGAEMKNDNCANWNKLLFETSLVSCYHKMMHLYKAYGETAFYSVWPTKSDMEGSKFEGFFQKLAQELLLCDIAYFPFQSKYLHLTETIVAPWNAQISDTVSKTLLQCGLPLVFLDPKLYNLLSFDQVPLLTPKIARDSLREFKEAYKDLNAEEKNILLEYCLEDGDLYGLKELELLPLASGRHGVFTNRSSGIYLGSESCPSCLLLPGFADHLVSDELPGNILGNIREIVRRRIFCIAELGPAIVARNMELTKKFIYNFWVWISSLGQKGLALKFFDDKKLVPVVGAQSYSCLMDTVIYVNPQDESHELIEFLQEMKIEWTSTTRFNFLCSEVTEFLKDSSAPGLLGILRKLQRPTFEPKTATFLCKYLKTRIEQLKDKKDIDILRSLSIFSTVHGELVSCNGMPKVLCLESDCFAHNRIPKSLRYLTSNFIDLLRLCRGRDVSVISEENFVLSHLYPWLCEDGSTLSATELDELMFEVLTRMNSFTAKYQDKVLESLADLPFLPVEGSTVRYAPQELFSPRKEFNPFTKIFEDEQDKFPTGEYATTYLTSLDRVLKKHMTTKEIITRFKVLDISTVTPVHLRKINALLEYTIEQKKLGKFNSTDLHFHIKSALSAHSVLPVMRQRPNTFPDCLPWQGEVADHQLTSLSKCLLYNDSLALACGSDCIFIDPAILPFGASQVQSTFPILPIILGQLARVVNSSSSLGDKVAHILDACYTEAQKALKTDYLYPAYPVKIAIQTESDWIFVDKRIVAFKPYPSFTQNLEPYLYVLPARWRDFHTFFTALGIKESFSCEQIINVLHELQKKDGINDEEVTTIVKPILNWAAEELDVQCLFPGLVDGKTKLLPASEVVYFDNPFFSRITLPSDLPPVVHHAISHEICIRFGVTPLSQFLNVDETMFEDVGQSEPLIVRLRNILKEYTGDLSIIKETLQNADDAKATEMNVLLDNRSHNCPIETLLFPGMSHSHSPALVFHNNAEFSEEDFKNITKLAGATKEKDPKKIGKYGLGFCTVYHLTDVPSIVSGRSLMIFDPTLQCLSKEITNKDKAGKKIDFTAGFLKSSNQMVPYEGLFGFQKTVPYPGTILRLPFRTSPSELNDITFGSREKNQILEECEKSGSKLLLFLPHVQKLTISEIGKEDTQPRLIWQVEKVDHGGGLVSINTTKGGSKTSEYWFITREETKNSLMITHIASNLKASQGNGPLLLNPITEGELFCFLPIGKFTGLPFHVNGNFALFSNRKDIHINSDKKDKNTKRNYTMVSELLPPHLIHHFQRAKELQYMRKELYYELWPRYSALTAKDPWSLFLDSFYALLKGDQNVRLFYSTKEKWVSFHDAKFLVANPPFFGEKEECYKSILHVLPSLDLVTVILPEAYQADIQKIDFAESALSPKAFLLEFFGKMESLDIKSRDAILVKMVKLYPDNKELLHQFLELPCIPCSAPTRELKKCHQLINPKAPFASLFIDADGFFPAQEFCDDMVMVTLKHFKLFDESLSVELAVWVANSLAKEYDETEHQKWMQKVNTLLKYLPPRSEIPELRDIAILPTLPCPQDFPLSWHATTQGTKLASLGELFYKSKSDFVGHNRLILNTLPVNEGGCGPLHLGCLGISQHVDIEETVRTLAELSWLHKENKISCDPETITSLVDQIYNLFRETLPSSLECPEMLELREFASVWTEGCFVHPRFVAKKWTQAGPYLYPQPDIPSILKRYLKIEDEFSPPILIEVLEALYSSKNAEKLSEREFLLVKEILQILDTKSCEIPYDCLNAKSVPLPDQNCVLRRACELTYHDITWQDPHKGVAYVSESIVPSFALKLGVKGGRSLLAAKHVISVRPFGQFEELTTRLKGILKGYKYDATLMKELIQNAEDAKATKMEVYLDYRVNATDMLPNDSWKELQGPALLVWNNSVFSEKDFMGICSLGCGSKQSNEGSIGEFGIGFNVVYHLTDCPSFITNDTYFCFLDPQSKYALEEGQVGGRVSLNPEDQSENFFETFQHLKASYFREGCEIPNRDIQKGTLFRFPLRKRESKLSSLCLEIDNLKKDIKRWLEEVRLSMLFLLNLEEINFYEIRPDSTCHKITSIFKTSDSNLSKADITGTLFASASDRHVRLSPLVVSIYIDGKKDEEWWIQHSRGHLLKEVDFRGESKLLIHSLAAPKWKYKPSNESDRGKSNREKFQGKICRFLPLPCNTSLPVHINGNFELDDTRSNLQKNSKGHLSKRNRLLFDAISASYALLLEDLARDFQRKPSNFYRLFPLSTRVDLFFPQYVLEYLWERNSAVIFSCHLPFAKPNQAEIRSELVRVRSRVYFAGKDVPGNIIETCMRLNMVVTDAPKYIFDELKQIANDKTEDCVLPLTPKEVMRFMKDQNHTRPNIHITDSPYQSVENLCKFLNFLDSEFQEDETPSVFGWDLLLGYDEMLTREKDWKLLACHAGKEGMFPNSPYLLHPALTGSIKLFKAWILSEDDEDVVSEVLHRLSAAYLPDSLMAISKDPVIYTEPEKIDQFWEFLDDHLEIFGDAIPSILKDWAVIPLDTGEYCPLYNGLRLAAPEKKEFMEVLKKYGILFVMGDSKAHRILHKQKRLTKKSNLLEAIAHYDTQPELTEEEILILLNELPPSHNNIGLWRNLRVFCTTGGQYTTLPKHATAHAVQKNQGSNIDLNATKDVIFLDTSKKWFPLCTYLGISTLTEEKMFDLFLEQDLTLLSPDFVHSVLEEIKSKKIASDLKDHPDAKVIYAENCFLEVSAFVNHLLPFYSTFKEFIPSLRYLPSKYHDRDWEELFIRLGLSPYIDPEHIKLLQSSSSFQSSDFFEGGVGLDRLKALLDTLDNITPPNYLKSLALIPAAELEFIDIAPVFTEDKLIPLKGSCYFQNAAQVWTVRPVLHSAVDGKLEKYGIQEIEVSEVIQHLRNLVKAIPNIQKLEKKAELFQVMFSIFHFLQENESLAFIFEEDFPCIPIEIVGTPRIDLGRPSVVFLGTKKKKEKMLYPYLHCLPQNFEELKENFSVLMPKHLQLLLQLVQKEVLSEAVNPNQRKVVLLAYKMLAKMLKRGSKLLLDLPLFLLNVKNQLRESTLLKYHDHRSIISCEEDPDTVLKALELQILIPNLPQQWQPLNISDLYKLRLSPTCRKNAEVDVHVTEGLSCILAHFLKGKDAKEYSKRITVYCVDQLELEKGDDKGNWAPAQSTQKLYLEKEEDAISIYKSENCKNRDYVRFSEELTEHIESLKYTWKDGWVKGTIADALDINNQKDLDSLLTEFHLESSVANQVDIDWTQLGIEIPAVYHHALLQSSIENSFFPGELVGYLNGNTFLIAEFLCYIPNGTQFPCCMICYQPERNETKVSILDIWKFSTHSFAPQSAMVVTDEVVSEEIHELEYEVEIQRLQKTLLELQNLDEKTREKAFKRLFLLWHPDKNPSKIATAVMVYLLEQIKRCRDGLPIKQFSTDSQPYYSSPDFSQFREWDQYATNSAPKQSRTHTRSSFSQPQPVKDVQKGLIWIEQAKEEFRVLETLQNNNEHHAYVVFMAHQVIEKCLKGGVYILVGVTNYEQLLKSHRVHHLYYLLELDHLQIDLDETAYLHPRYPNVWANDKVPYLQYSWDDAKQAANQAKQILQEVISKVEEQGHI